MEFVEDFTKRTISGILDVRQALDIYKQLSGHRALFSINVNEQARFLLSAQSIVNYNGNA